MAKRVKIPEGSGLLSFIGDEHTIAGFLLTGVGHVDSKKNTNFFTVKPKTTKEEIERVFHDFTHRPDVSILIINQYIADIIRDTVDAYSNPIPVLLEIPSKDHPYDVTRDSVMARVLQMTGGVKEEET